MILETAIMTVGADQHEQFQQALAEAVQVLAQADGFAGISVSRGVERDDAYLLRIAWRSLEDHTVGFRESELFTRWRALIGPYFAEAPVVEHWAPVDGLG